MNASKDFKKNLKEKAEAKKQKKGSRLIAVRLPAAVHNAVQELCSSTGLNQSEVIIESLKLSLGIKK